MAEQQKT